MSTSPKLLYGSEQLRLESVVSRMLTSLHLCPVPIPNISEVVGLLKWILSAPVLLPPLCTSLNHTYIYEDGGHLWICFEFHMRSWKQNSIIQLQVAAIALQSGPHVLRHQPPKSNEKQRGSNAMAVRNTVTASMYDFDWSCLNWFLWFPPPHFFCTFHSRSTHPWQLWTQVPHVGSEWKLRSRLAGHLNFLNWGCKHLHTKPWLGFCKNKETWKIKVQQIHIGSDTVSGVRFTKPYVARRNMK